MELILGHIFRINVNLVLPLLLTTNTQPLSLQPNVGHNPNYDSY